MNAQEKHQTFHLRGYCRRNGYNGIGQGGHGQTFLGKWGQASLPCLYTFPNYCVNSGEVYPEDEANSITPQG